MQGPQDDDRKKGGKYIEESAITRPAQPLKGFRLSNMGKLNT
jgi:hypothetical protein